MAAPTLLPGTTLERATCPWCTRSFAVRPYRTGYGRPLVVCTTLGCGYYSHHEYLAWSGRPGGHAAMRCLLARHPDFRGPGPLCLVAYRERLGEERYVYRARDGIKDMVRLAPRGVSPQAYGTLREAMDGADAMVAARVLAGKLVVVLA